MIWTCFFSLFIALLNTAAVCIPAKDKPGGGPGPGARRHPPFPARIESRLMKAASGKTGERPELPALCRRIEDLEEECSALRRENARLAKMLAYIHELVFPGEAK